MMGHGRHIAGREHFGMRGGAQAFIDQHETALIEAEPTLAQPRGSGWTGYPDRHIGSDLLILLQYQGALLCTDHTASVMHCDSTPVQNANHALAHRLTEMWQ